MTPIPGQSGRNVFPEYPLVDNDCAPSVGEWIPFTDGTRRRISKVEQTIGYGAQGDRYMVTTTILFDDDQSMWIMPEVAT